MQRERLFKFDSVGLVLVLATFAVNLVNMRSYLSGRFWAEEGRDFYTSLWGNSWTEMLTHTHHAHLELATNLVVYLGTLVPLYYAPLLTSYLSLAIQSIPVILLIGYRRALKLNTVALLAFIIIVAGLPQADEVQSNAINLHSHLALLALVILVLPPVHGVMRPVLVVLLLFAGLGGVPPNVLLPAFLLRAVQRRDRESLIYLLILFLTCALQLFLLSQDPAENAARRAHFLPLITLLATFSQTLLMPLYEFTDATFWMKDHVGQVGLLLVMVGFCVAVLALVYYRCYQLGPSYVPSVFVAMLSLICVSSYAAIGSRADLIVHGGRYFFAPNVMFYLVLMVVVGRLLGSEPVSVDSRSGSGKKNRAVKTLDHLLLLFFALVCWKSITTGLERVTHGPAWQSAYHEAVKVNTGVVAIWPAGWHMKVNRELLEPR